MTDPNLIKISADEDLMDDFFITLSDEMASDDEPSRKKFRRLMDAYEQNPEIVDDIMMTLCGWTIESLASKTFE